MCSTFCSAKSVTSLHVNGGLDTRLANKFCRYFQYSIWSIVVYLFSLLRSLRLFLATFAVIIIKSHIRQFVILFEPTEGNILCRMYIIHHVPNSINFIPCCHVFFALMPPFYVCFFLLTICDPGKKLPATLFSSVTGKSYEKDWLQEIVSRYLHHRW